MPWFGLETEKERMAREAKEKAHRDHMFGVMETAIKDAGNLCVTNHQVEDLFAWIAVGLHHETTLFSTTRHISYEPETQFVSFDSALKALKDTKVSSTHGYALGGLS